MCLFEGSGEKEGWAAGEVGCGGQLQLVGWWATLIQSGQPSVVNAQELTNLLTNAALVSSAKLISCSTSTIANSVS